MEDKNNRIISLITKVEEGIATELEIQELNAWYDTFDDEEEITSNLTKQQKAELGRKVFHRIDQNIPFESPSRFRRNSIRYISILTLLVLCASVFLWKRSDLGVSKKDIPVSDVAPGSQVANLTLSDGSVIALNQNKLGKVAEQAQTQIVQEADGFLRYIAKNAQEIDDSSINKVTTPVGGTYKIILPDGTKVWLNAGSSIEFPSRFDLGERSVRTSGEVYFEVASFKHPKTNSKIPFRVISAKGINQKTEQIVEVLGTHFNINSYNDQDDIKTTLLEGAVAVSKTFDGLAIKSVKLIPGQQSSVGKSNAITVSKPANLGTIVAWKDGKFEFNETSLKDLLNQFSKWYNIDVEFHPDTKNETFNGKIDRNYTLQEAIKTLELSNVHIELVESKDKPNVKATLKVLP